MIFEKNHPYWHLRSIVKENINVKILTFSYYKYRPQSLIDERTSIHVDREIFLADGFIERISNECPLGQDLAFHSLTTCHDGIARHLPMVDMSTNARAHLSKIKSSVDPETLYGFAWFESGRSFHGYGSRFITHTEWIAFMGQLLLSNQKDLKPTVDPRWIGHRLIAGYAALRWTRNTEHYIRLPQRIFE